MQTRVELVRQQWEQSYRDLTVGVPPRIDAAVLEQVESVQRELRRRVGSSFTLAELAETYEGADRWTYAAIAERQSSTGWIRTATAATDAAFHLYARGARDYEP